jgi:uncharacterized protein YcbX
VVALWRYPAKSLRGERLERGFLAPSGLEGDRRFALRDPASGRVLSAKRIARLLEARAVTVDGAVRILLPSGEVIDLRGPDAAARLSAWLERPVEVAGPPAVWERPVIESEDGVFRGRSGGFFDASAVHLLTTGTVDGLRRLGPGGFDARRFRPNVLLDASPAFVEERWVGRILRLGAARVEVSGPCERCVMTTHAQEELPVDREVLRTVRRGRGGVVGVYGIVRTAGEVSLGDAVLLEEA